MAERILVVDDDDELRGGVATLLSDEGYIVDQAIDGVDALSCISQNRPDAILLDYFMPRMDGREFLQKLRDRGDEAPIPVIVMSAVDALYSERQLSIRESDLVAKPIEADVLLGKVALALYRSRGEDEEHGDSDDDAAAVANNNGAQTRPHAFTVIAVDASHELQRDLDTTIGEAGMVIGVSTPGDQLLRLVRTLAPDVVALAARTNVSAILESARAIAAEGGPAVIIGTIEEQLDRALVAASQFGGTAVAIEQLVDRVMARVPQR